MSAVMTQELKGQRTEMERLRVEAVEWWVRALQAESDAKIKAQAMESRLDEQWREMEQQRRAAISHEQLRMIQSRLEALHAAQLLSDDEFFVLEDLCADIVELESSLPGGQLTMEMVQTNPLATKACKIAALSQRLESDVSFARQLRRKYM
jgi:hypothetical protein